MTSKTGISSDLAAQMVQVARLVRAGYDKQECFCTFSTRRLLAWGSLAARFGSRGSSKKALVKGYRLAAGNKLPPEDAVYVAGVLQRVIGVTV